MKNMMIACRKIPSDRDLTAGEQDGIISAEDAKAEGII